MKSVCFSPKIMVRCGKGVNLYFGNFDWNSAGYLKRLIDNMKAHQLMQTKIELTPDNLQWNAGYIADHRRKIAFHTLRRFFKNNWQWPAEIKHLAHDDKYFAGWFCVSLFQVVIGRVFGLYRA
jgi:hypothetical protein